MRKLQCILLFVMFFTLTGKGQVPFFQQYFLKNKNEPVKVNIVFQDKSGFVWCGADKGLFKFDGLNRISFSTADGMPVENVTTIAQDSTGRIWAGLKNGRIIFLENGIVNTFQPAEGNTSGEISDMLFDKKGNLWFSTHGDGLYYFTESRLFRLDENEKMPSLFIYDLACDNEGNVLAGTDGGVVICSLEDKTASLKVLNYQNGLPDIIIKKIIPAAEGTMWLGTDNAGIVFYDSKIEKFTYLLHRKWEFGSITDFIVTRSQVWVACREKGLMAYHKEKNLIKSYSSNSDLDLSYITCLLEDYEGNVWTGTRTGLLRSSGDYIEYVDRFGTQMDENILALATDKEGNIWFSNKKGLFRRRVDGSGNIFIEKQLSGTHFNNSSIISLFVDEIGFVWAGLYGEGVIRINPLTGKTRSFRKELNDGNVLNISGRDNIVWLATLGGVTKITIDGDDFQTKNYGAAEGLRSSYIYQVFIDKMNRVWLATDGNGIEMLDESGIHHYTAGLKSKTVYGFATDCFQQVWANVQGEGIFRFDGGKFVPANKQFRNNNINCLSTDKSGNLVVMHDFGIDIYDIRNNNIVSLGDEVGIQEKIPNLNAVSKDDQGNIYFGTYHGIVIYSGLSDHRISNPIPNIEGIKVLDNNFGISKSLSVKYNENDITFSYQGFWYQNRENLLFRYKLDNYNKEWILSKTQSATYSNLPPGEYTFRLQATDKTEFNGIKESSFHFVILPPFWKTNSFYAISLFTIVLLIYSFIKYRERKLQHDKKILEEKNIELKKTNMELDKFVYSVSHDLRAPLSSMLGVIEISEDETQDELQLKHLGMLKGSIKKLDGFILDILNYSRNSRLIVIKEEINFNEMLNDITNNLKHATGNANKLNIDIDVDTPVPFHSDRHRLGVVLNNVISNAIRYQKPEAESQMVAIKVITTQSEACIVVKDNGIGIQKENHKKIFDMFYHISENSVGSGLGLYIVKETIEKLNGKIELESDLGKGTEFSIRIPNEINKTSDINL